MAGTAPASVLQAAINRLMDQGKAADGTSTAGFIQSETFHGPKAGYYFGKGGQGVGYYKDHKQQAQQQDGAAEDEAAAAPVRKRQLAPEELLRQAEEAANIDELQLLDARGLRRLVLIFERKYRENLELRSKWADQPDKFLDSEVDLDEQIKSLMQVASVPELYPDLLELNVVPSLCNLLSHENTDILADVIELLSELTGADAIESNEEETRQLVEALLEHSCLELLVQRLGQLNEANDEEAAAAHSVLAIFENMVEVKPEVAELVLEKTKLLRWLLARIGRTREMDSNKLYASELLAILLQGSAANQRRFAAAGGVDSVLVQAIAPYRKEDPKGGEEEEFLQNCFDVLCSALMCKEGRAEFHKSQGIDLMVVILKGKRLARYGALKTIDFATTRFPEACERLIDQSGLPRLFPIFMAKNKVKGPAGEHDVEAQVEERCVSVISNLFYGLAAKGERRQRLAAKFVEAEFEKCDRLLEVYFKYEARVQAEEVRLAERLEAGGSDGEDLDEDDLLLARMGAGLYTLQQCCLIIGNLWAAGDVALRKRILMLLHQKGRSLGQLKELLLEHYVSIGDDGEQEEAERLRRKLSKLLLAMGVEAELIEELNAAKAKQQEQQRQEQQQQQEGAAGAAADGADAPAALAPAAAAAAAAGAPQADMDVEMEVDDEEPAAANGQAEQQLKQEQQQDEAGGKGSERAPARAATPDEEPSGHSSKQREDREDREERERGREGRRARGREGDRHREDKPRDKDREREKERERDRHRDDKHKERHREREHRDKERDRDYRRDERKDRKRDRDDEHDDYRRSKR